MRKREPRMFVWAPFVGHGAHATFACVARDVRTARARFRDWLRDEEKQPCRGIDQAMKMKPTVYRPDAAGVIVGWMEGTDHA